MTPDNSFRKNSILVIAGNSITGLGNSMYLVALLAFVTTEMPHPANIGFLQAAAYIPIVLFSVTAGFFADRGRRVAIIAGSDLLRSLFLSLCALSLLTMPAVHPLVFIIPMVFLNGVMQSFFMPAVISFILDYQRYTSAGESSTPSVRRRPDLLSLRTGSGHLASLLGQSIGAGLYVALGIVPMLFINAASFLLSGVSELFLTDSRKEKPAGGVRHSFKGVLHELYRAESEGAPILLYLVAQAAGAAVLVNLPFFLTQRHLFPPSYLGFAMAALFGGSILSGIFLGMRGTRPGAASGYIAAIVSAAGLVGAGLLPGGNGPGGIALLLPFLMLSGAGMGWLHIVTLHWVYYLGRQGSAASRQGFLEAAGTAVLPASYLASGFVFERLPLDTPWVLRTVGAAMLVLSVYFLVQKRASHAGGRSSPQR